MVSRSASDFDPDVLLEIVAEVARAARPGDPERVAQRPWDRGRALSARFADAPPARRIAEARPVVVGSRASRAAAIWDARAHPRTPTRRGQPGLAHRGLYRPPAYPVDSMQPGAEAPLRARHRTPRQPARGRRPRCPTKTSGHFVVRPKHRPDGANRIRRIAHILRLVASNLDVRTLTPAQYRAERSRLLAADASRWRHGGQLRLPNEHQLATAAGGWQRALRLAGLSGGQGRGGPRSAKPGSIIELIERCFAFHGCRADEPRHRGLRQSQRHPVPAPQALME